MSEFLDKDKIISSLTKEDVIKICMDLGSGYPKKDSQDNLIFNTICHNASGGSYKLYYYHDPVEGESKGRLFHCYTDCGDSFGIIELVIRANRTKGKTITWYQALYYIASITNNLFYDEDKNKSSVSDYIEDWSWLNQFKTDKKSRSIPQLKEINEHVLELFSYYPHEAFLNDNINRQTLSEFEIGYYGLTNQITIPHRDYYGRLVGVRGRYLDAYDVETIGKYVPMYINGDFLSHQLGSNLYGIHVNKNKIKSCKKVLIVEGEKSVMQNHSYFGEDDFALATCGSSLSVTQIKILLEMLDIKEIILGYDKEFEDVDSFRAKAYFNKLVKVLSPVSQIVNCSIIWDDEGLLDYKDSPTDKGKETLLKLLNKKIIIS